MRTKDEFNEQKQRQQLLNAAWKLFYQNGYQNNNARFHHKHTEDIPIIGTIALMDTDTLGTTSQSSNYNKHIVHNSDKEDRETQKAIDN